MRIVEHAAGSLSRRLGRRSLVPILCSVLLLAVWPGTLSAQQDQQGQQQQPQDQQAQGQGASAPPYAQQSPEQLQRLVAPIALYPDSLVAQILAAATFPEQVVEADRWVQANPDLKGDALGRAVDQQPWDPSVKALTAFPSVLGNMDKNLSWASSLGDAYFNQQGDVMDAVQVMRRRAQAAGDLKTTSQQNVSTQGSTIEVEPSDPQTVYRPGVQSVAGLRRAHRRVAGLVSVSRNLVRRPVPVVGWRVRHWLVRRVRMGLESLGIQLGWPIRNVRWRQVLLPKQHVL